MNVEGFNAKGLPVTEIGIGGMMCGHCEMMVKKVLEGLDGIEEARTSHTENKALTACSKPLDEAAVRRAVEEAGYEFLYLKA